MSENLPPARATHDAGFEPGGGDYRPRFQGREEWRWYVTAGLELPLYLLH